MGLLGVGLLGASAAALYQAQELRTFQAAWAALTPHQAEQVNEWIRAAFAD